jgi:glutaredoxin
MRVRIYIKPACSLCEEARQVLERVRRRLPFELVEEDIRAAPELLAAWRYDIPVVVVEGRPAFRLRLVEQEVEDYLRGVLGGTRVAGGGDQER